MEIGGTRMCLGLSEFSVPAVWSCNTIFVTTLKRKNSLHLRHIGHQNTKTSQYKVSKTHWVYAVFDFFGSIREILQVTVSFDHPVSQKYPHIILKISPKYP